MTRMRLICSLLAVVTLASLTLRCADDPVSSSRPSFSFGVSVTDQSGEIVDGLRVSVQNHLSDLDGLTSANDLSGQQPITHNPQRAFRSPLDLGDINCNGVPYQIADAMLYIDYFTDGLEVFDDHPVCSIEASDVNADGNSLTVADLVYLIRIIVMDALPVQPGDTADAYIIFDQELGVLAIDGEDVGGAFIRVAGEVVPQLLADHMSMQYAFDGTHTNIIIYSWDLNGFFNGGFLVVNGDIVSIEAATYYGVPLRLKVIPYGAAFYQNYPNPFHETTTFNFALPDAGDYRLIVKDLHNEIVDSVVGSASAGVTEIEWDASLVPDGVYCCNLTIADSNAVLFSESLYAVKWQPIPATLGYTSTDGVFETDDSLSFPGVWVLPELIQTSETSELIGSFSYSDTVTIVLTDTLAGIDQMFNKAITSGVNQFDLVWYLPD
ncbi:MAG: hypothetical protein KAT79_04140 [candidate division Zixibacteria bacterium]|nr:hypothetical protein [candidate division Zixibacteria bacterium]